MAIEKIKILGALLEIRQCCLAGSSNTAPRIFIFSIVLGAEYLPYVKFIATYALTFFGCIISVLAMVPSPGFENLTRAVLIMFCGG